MSNRGISIAFLVGAILATNPAYSGEVATGSIVVCRKPMMVKLHIALTASIHTPKNKAESKKVFRAMQEIQRELQQDQQKYCFTAQRIEITGGGEEKFELSWGHWCKEFTALANGEEVYVAYGSKKKQYGHCP